MALDAAWVRIGAMPRSAAPSSILFTETEVRSYLPSGWRIVAGSVGRWDGSQEAWAIDVYDGADNVWKLEVAGDTARDDGRLAALQAAVRRLERKKLGRKSILTG